MNSHGVPFGDFTRDFTSPSLETSDDESKIVGKIPMHVTQISDELVKSEFETGLWINRVVETAKKEFESEGNLGPKAFIYWEDGGKKYIGIFPILCDSPQEKDISTAILKSFCNSIKADQLLMVMESWMVEYKAGNPDGLEFLPPSRHPRRKEVITLSLETKGQVAKQSMLKIDRTGKVPTFDSNVVWNDVESRSGRFSGILD